MSKPTAASQSKRITEINRLLALAEGTSHPEEATTARERAERLMVRYGVDAAMLESSDKAEKATEDIIQTRIEFRHPQCTGLMQMGNAIAHGFGTVRTLRSGDRKHYEELYLIGFKSDVENVERLIRSMEIQALVALGQWWAGYLPQHRHLTANERFMAKRQFLSSFGSGAASRIRKATKEATRETTGSEIVLVDRSKKVDHWMEQQYRGGLRKGRGTRGSAHGSGEGYAAGQRANTSGVGTGKSGAIGR